MRTSPDSPPSDTLPHQQRRARRPKTDKRLRRSTHTRRVAGVLGGLAEFVDADPFVVRTLFVIATVLSGGIVALGYPLLWLLLPAETSSA